MSEKQLPYNFDAEQSVLGAALQNIYAADEASETLWEDAFFERRHAEIFAAISELTQSKKPVDLVTVAEALKRRGSIDAVGGVRYLSELVSAVPAPSSVSHYADIVREHSTRRRLIELSERIITRSFSGKGKDDAEEVLEYAEQEILEIGRSGQKEDYTPVSEIVDPTIERIEELSKLGAGEYTGLKTGFTRLDKMTLGLQKSNLIILAARPGEGKTSLALNIALNAALLKQAVVLFFSLEMNKEDLVQRMFAVRGGIELTQIRSGQVLRDPSKAQRLGEVAEELATTKIVIDDTSAIQINEIKNKCRRLSAREGGVDLVVIDYLQLMDLGFSAKTTARPENRQQEIATLTRMLKQLARDVKCPVLVLSQLSREVERRSGKKPVLSDLRESGAIEQDADVVMFIYQEDTNKDGIGPDIDKTRQLIIAKHRNGETGSITLQWHKEFTRFSNYDSSADWLVNVDNTYSNQALEGSGTESDTTPDTEDDL